MANEMRLIDVDAFLEHWNKQYRHLYPCDMYKVTIANFPTVDARPVVHGRWKNIRFITTGDGRAKVGDCSSCKSIERVRNYCPNCGAKMDGGNEDG